MPLVQFAGDQMGLARCTATSALPASTLTNESMRHNSIPTRSGSTDLEIAGHALRSSRVERDLSSLSRANLNAAALVDRHIRNSVMPQFGGSFARRYGCKAGAGFPMRSIAFVTQKGGAGKTTLTASLAVAAAATGEKVVALDLDPQASLVRWSERRKAANAPNMVVIEPLESERLPQLSAILDGLADVGFTVAVFDTTDAGGVHLVIDSVDLCLLPVRPTRLDVDAAGATYRAAFLAKRRAAFVLNQCPSTYRTLRASVAAQELMRLGVLAEPMLPACIDFQDAFAAGLGVTEHARDGKAAQQIDALWRWTGAQFGKSIAEVKENVAVTGGSSNTRLNGACA